VASVAIAIPNLNGGKYLFETLKSLQRQKEKPDEIIISDNHSSDDSLEIINLFSNLNIRVVQPDRFLKMSENWNYAADQTSSDWFFLLSNDDLLRNSAIKRLKEIVSNLAPSIGVVSFKSEIIDENSRLVLGKYRFGKPKIWNEHEFLCQNIKFLHINAASVAIKKVAWIDTGKFPDEYSVLHDLVFYQRVISKWGILESKDVLGRYRIYNHKPNSEARSKLVLDDFLTYERNDLRFHSEKYPDLMEIYSSDRFEFSTSFLGRNLRLRKAGLSIMTMARRAQSIFGHSGFPNDSRRD
jgi:glycosyltransferase involved in cell wall biosynthesis